jgi:hypothetical protein
MLQLQDIRELLKGTFLEDAMMVELQIPRTTDVAIAIAVNSQSAIEAWKLLKNHLDQTQRYPVVTTCWSGFGETWEQKMRDEDLFNRFYFDEEYPEGLSPEAIIAKADCYAKEDLDRYLSSQAQIYTYDLEQELLSELENTKTNFGIAPSLSEIKESAKIFTILDIEHYLFNWEYKLEQTQNLKPTLYLDYQDWFEPRDQVLALVLLPNPHSWNALAYLSWFGGSKNAIYLIKQWYQNYGAELVCHYGTMLQFFVSRRPADLQIAFELAWQQVGLAQCTTALPGVSIRDHARALLELDRWFIHERP